MDGVGVVAARGVQDFFDDEIAFRGGRGSQVRGLVGELHGERGAVGVGIDGDAADVGLAEGADDADGDFASVGDENFGNIAILCSGEI